MKSSERLRELREIRGLEMKEVAAALGIPYTTYVNYEKGKREPGHLFLCKVADLYEVSVDYLIGRAISQSANESDNAKWDGTLQSLKDKDRILLSHIGELSDEERRFIEKQIDILRRERERGDA